VIYLFWEGEERVRRGGMGCQGKSKQSGCPWCENTLPMIIYLYIDLDIYIYGDANICIHIFKYVYIHILSLIYE
jgi:hypothetical protein